MTGEPFNNTISPIEPLYDTWGAKKYAGSWCINPTCDFTVMDTYAVNDWFRTTTSDTLKTFSPLTRAWQVSFRTIYRDDISESIIDWQFDHPYETFLSNVANAIQAYPAPIYSLDIAVDLLVYIRTQASANQPVKAWVRLPSEFRIWGGPENPEPSLCLSMAHTLFSPWSKDGEDNRELYQLNQPLLEQALRSWEQRFGAISDVEGLVGIYPYGFSDELPL